MKSEQAIKNDLRTRSKIVAFFRQYGIDPVLQSWDGEGGVSLDETSGVTYAHLGRIINEHSVAVCDDDGEVQRALAELYEYFSAKAEEEIKKETMERISINDGSQRERWLHTWEGLDGCYGCTSGLSRSGIYSEGEDSGPFSTREDAVENVLYEEEEEEEEEEDV